MTSAIYGILNLLNSKIYIGSAVEVYSRFRVHKSRLNLNKHPSKHLQGAWNKYGELAFEFVILENCNKQNLLDREAFWFELTDCCNPECGYNKRKIPNSNLGLKLGPASDERKKKISEIHKGRIISIEQREATSKALTGRKLSSDHIANVANAIRGKPASEQRKAKIGAANSRPDLWPHEKKYNCNCRECLNKKNAIRRLKRYNHEGEFRLD